MRAGRTGDALNSDLELKTDDGIDVTDVRTIAACRSYALGYVDAATDMGVASGNFAVPDGVTRRQITDIYLKWAKEHPEKLHVPAWECVFGALREAFPKK
jgi:hypothetical protein